MYGWAVHYYMEDDVQPEPVKSRVEVKTPVAKSIDIKPIKALVKDKKNENKCVELDMFADFGL